jgi:hypothetical protein
MEAEGPGAQAEPAPPDAQQAAGASGAAAGDEWWLSDGEEGSDGGAEAGPAGARRRRAAVQPAAMSHAHSRGWLCCALDARCAPGPAGDGDELYDAELDEKVRVRACALLRTPLKR